VNRRAFAGRIADKTELLAITVEQVLTEAIVAFREELAKGGRFEWRGLGTFVVRSYPARKIHNPKTGKTITIPARRSVGFKPSQAIRALLPPPSRGRSKATQRRKGKGAAGRSND